MNEPDMRLHFCEADQSLLSVEAGCACNWCGWIVPTKKKRKQIGIAYVWDFPQVETALAGEINKKKNPPTVPMAPPFNVA